MAKKAKSTKKPATKVSNRDIKKELETSITDKFMEAVSGLGHDASKLGKDIKRVSKQLAKKLSEKLKNATNKLDSNKKAEAKGLKKPITAPKVDNKKIAKAEKVVTKIMAKPASNTNVKPVKRAYVRRAVNPVVDNTSTSAPKTIVKKAVASTKPAAAKPDKSIIAAKQATEKISKDVSETNNGNPQEQPKSTN